MEIEDGGFLQIFRERMQLVIVAWGNSNPGVKVDRRGKNETVIVVGVFTDEIDSARSTKNSWHGTEASRKGLRQPDCDVGFAQELSHSFPGKVQRSELQNGMMLDAGESLGHR